MFHAHLSDFWTKLANKLATSKKALVLPLLTAVALAGVVFSGSSVQSSGSSEEAAAVRPDETASASDGHESAAPGTKAKAGQALGQQARPSGNYLPLNISNEQVSAEGAEQARLSHGRVLKFFPALAVGPVTASMTDTLVNDDSDTKIDPTNGTPATEERITYTVTIKNNGTDPATHVKFTDIIDSHTTLVGGSVNTSPIADVDAYTASGNIPISLNAAGGVLANDVDPDTGNNSSLTVTEVQGATGNVGVATATTQAGRGGVKGSVTLFADGHFTYEPPPGFTGDDTFTYKISDGTTTDTTTVTITITGVVWFIQTGAGGSDMGTFSNPFKTIATFNTANAAPGTTPNPKDGDIIALRAGSYSETDGINLRNTQKLIGEAVQFNTVFTASTNSSSAYTTFASGTAAAPTITTSGGNGVDLADSNTVRGLNVGNTPGFFGFNGGAVGSPVINTVNVTGTGGAINISTSGAFGANVTFATLESSTSPTSNINLVGVTGTLGVTSGGAGLTGSTANAVTISGGSVSMSYPGNVTKASAGSLVNVSGGHSGTLTFPGTLSATAGDGLQFKNADGTYNFNGTTTLSGSVTSGITIGDTGVAATGSVGTFTFNSNTTITNPTNEAIAISSSVTSPSAPTVTYSGSFTKTNGTRGILVQNNSSGTITFDGPSATETKTITTTGSANAIDLLSNPGVTINFTGNNLLLTAGVGSTGAGLNATGGGTLTVQGTGNTISTASGTALNVSATSIGAGGLTFLSIASNGGTNGIVLNNVGTGGLTVTGTGTTPGSGGTIQNKQQGAVFMTMSNLSLKNMTFTNAGSGSGTCQNVETTAFNDNSVLNSGCQAAINLRSVTTATLDRLVLNGGLQNGINGQTVSGLTISNSTVQNFGDNVNEDPLRLFNLTGTCSITNSTFQNGGEFLADIRNITSTALNLTVDTVTFTDTDSSAFGAAGFSITGAGTSNMTLLVDNSTFTKIVNAAFQVIGKSTAVMNMNFTDSSVEQQTAATGRAVDIGAQNSAQINFNINHNTKLYSKGGTSVNIYSFDTATIQGRVNNNTDIRCGGVGSPGTGVAFQPQDNSVGTVEIIGNTISQIGSSTDAGIRVLAFGDGATEHSATADATVTSNNITLVTNGLTGGSYVGGLFGIQMQGGSQANDTIKTCGDVRSNAVSATPTAINNSDNIAFRVRAGSTAPNASFVYLENFTTDASTTWNNNSNTPTNSTSVNNGSGGSVSAPPAGAPYNGVCRAPSNTTAMLNFGDDFRNTVAQSSTPPEFVSGTATLWASLAHAENNPSSGVRQIEHLSDLLAAQARTTIATYSERLNGSTDEPAMEGFAAAAIGSDPHASLVASEASATGAVAVTSEQQQQPAVLMTAATAITGTAAEATNAVALASSEPAQTVTAASSQSKRRDMVLSHALKMRTRPSALAAAALVSGETVTVDGGAGVSPANSGFTLPGGKTITVTFQVTLNNPPNVTYPWPTGGPQVSTFGTVTGDGGINVQTDDPTPPSPLPNGATDPTVTYVDLFNSQTALASDNPSTNQNDSVTFTATVSLDTVGSPAGTPPTPTQTVDFFDGTAIPANAITGCTGKTLDGTGKATCTTSTLPPGVHTITARYNGDGNYETSTGTTPQTVIACATNPVVTSTADSGANTLREAITTICSAPNNNVTFNLGAGPHTITTASTLVIAKDINISNTLSGTNGPVTIDAGGGNFNVFRVDSPVTTVNISNLTVSGATATSVSGGGLLVQSGTVTLTGMLFTGNTVINGDGGGVTAGSSSTVNIRNSTISGNTARHGGGLFSSGGAFNLLNVTVTNNNANGNAGTGACPIGGSVNGAGGAIETGGNPTNIKNSILAGNTACDTGALNVSGASTDQGNNILSGNPQLAALFNNGGATRTHALLSNSPALDAGDNTASDAASLTTDQRGTGFLRKRDAASDADTTQTVDIGAFEADPSVENIANQTTPEDTPLNFNFRVGDGDAAATAFDSIAGTSSDTTLVPNASIVVGPGSGGGGGGQTRSLTITPAADKSGTTTITITATKTINGTVLSMSDSFDLTVTPVNDSPTATADPIASVAEDSGQRTILISDLLANDLKGPADESGQTLTLTLVGSPVGGTVTNDVTNVYFTPTADYNGAASFQYTITDDGTSGSPAAPDPKTSSGAVTFTITEVNDAPTAAADSLSAVAEDSGQRIIPFSALVGNDSKGPANESLQTLIVKTVSNPIGGAVVLDTPNSQVLFTPTADFTGTASFDYTVEDNGTTNGASDPQTSAAAATVSFSVTPVADAPSVSGTTTNEDTQSTSGLVISRNAADGAEVTHFKITSITGGTLFKNDGVTAIANNSFITFAEGQAGLKFTPTADLYSPSSTFSFQVQSATDGTGTGLSTGFATATITVNPVGDTPSVTNATTDEDTQSTSGLVITKNGVDGAEVTHFKITNITGGTLYKNDGTTQINNGDFITVVEGGAGLKFTPTNNLVVPGSFRVFAALDGTGTGLSPNFATATIFITPTADTPTITATTTAINTQSTSGLVISRNTNDGAEVTHFKITNITGGTLYKNDGTTQINDGDFITFAEGQAGLKFTPGLNLSTSNGDTFGFDVYGATDGTGTGLSTGFASASITVDCQSGLVVTNTLDDGSAGTLRHAVEFSCPGSTITFDLGAGPHTITLGSELPINKNLTITGPTTPLTLSGGGVTRIFSVTTGFTVSISNLTITGGQADVGGGIYSLGDLTISNMTFTGNAAVGGSGEGGAIDTEGGNLTIVNSTISGNTAETDGGGLLSCGNSTTTLVNVTITNNRADSDNNGTGAGGGIGQVSSNALTLHNTIVAGNFNEDGATDAPDDVFVNTSLSSSINASSSNNLIGVDTGVANITNGSGGNQIGTAATPLDARLGALASNGGTTQTHALLAGSPALDKGSDSAAATAGLTTDQRGTGFGRKLDAASDADTTQTVDIGAFEADPSVEDITDKATAEDTALPSFTFKVGDAASAFDSITATSSDTTLVPNASITVGADTASTRTLSITPAANLSGTTTITVTVKKTIGGTEVSMSDSFVLTVSTVPDAPSVTPASTNEDTQTTSGLVVTKNALDGAEVTHFKITSITGGTLFKNDGVTQINNGDFITVAEGGAGLKFTPAADSFAGGSFLAQSSTDAVGTVLSATATGTITVNAVSDTPSATNATTNEDTQTTTGLVISRNAADGAEVTHFKITSITNGTLYKSNGTTQINNGDFITFAEGQAGLKFTPAANLSSQSVPPSTFSFQVQGAIGAGGAGLSASAATATITVNTVADTPSVTNATTNEDTQTTSGLVISRNAADGVEVTHFKITSITNGTLFKNDGVTAIANNSFITVAEGQAGLKFTPASNSNTNGSFSVQASLSGVDAGLGGGTATATITVNNVNDAPTLDAIGNLTINEDDPQQTVNLTGIGAGPFETQTLVVTATSNNTGLIPNPAVNYVSPNATGSLTFTPVADQSGSAIITVTVNDGGGTANGGAETVVRTFTVTVNAVNDAPVNTVPGAQLTDADTALTFSAAKSNLISISDVDAAAAAVRVTLTATNGTLTLSSTAGLAFTVGDGTADATMTFTGTLASINAALNGLVFAPTPGFDGAASVQITTNDLGNTGSGGALSDTDTVNITVDKRSFRFSLSAYTVGEAEGHALITVTRTGGTGSTARVDYATSDLAGLNNCSVNTGDASARCDYTAVGGTLVFMPGEASKTFTVPVINDVYVEGPEVLTLTLSNVVGDAVMGTPSVATLTITDNDNTPGAFNPIDTREFLIRQLYLDTLNREPEPAGLAAWLARLNNCPQPGETLQNCDEIEVASAFFRSPEFFDRSFFLYKFYEASLVRQPQYDEYQLDLRKMTGFLTTEELEQRKAQFMEEFVSRQEFRDLYDSFANGQPFVDAVLARAGSARPGVGEAVVVTSNRQSVINRLGAGQITRGQALRELMEAPEISQRFFNKAFVVVGYFAFLRRNPDAAYLMWINMLNNTGDYREMIRGFLQSPEFRLRFGQM